MSFGTETGRERSDRCCCEADASRQLLRACRAGAPSCFSLVLVDFFQAKRTKIMENGMPNDVKETFSVVFSLF